MYIFFFSLSSDILFISILKNNQEIAVFQRENKYQHAENFSFYLRKLLEKSKLNLSEVEEIYFTSTPSNHTGIRVSLTFLISLQTIKPQIKIYHINSLLFQSSRGKTISLLTIDKKKTKFHVAVYWEEKCLKESQIINYKQLKILEEDFPDFPFFFDYLKVNFLENFHHLKKNFKEIKNVSEIYY